MVMNEKEDGRYIPVVYPNYKGDSSWLYPVIAEVT
jgi:hypothetical protein